MSIDFLINKKEGDSSKNNNKKKEEKGSKTDSAKVYEGALDWSVPQQDYYKMDDKLKELDKTKTKTHKEGDGVFSFLSRSKDNKKEDQKIDSLHFSDEKHKERVNKSRAELLRLIADDKNSRNAGALSSGKKDESSGEKKDSFFSRFFGLKSDTKLVKSPIKKEASVYGEIKKSNPPVGVSASPVNKSAGFSVSSEAANIPATSFVKTNSANEDKGEQYKKVLTAETPAASKKTGFFNYLFSSSQPDSSSRSVSVQNGAVAEKAKLSRLDKEKKEKEEIEKEKNKRKEEIDRLKREAAKQASSSSSLKNDLNKNNSFSAIDRKDALFGNSASQPLKDGVTVDSVKPIVAAEVDDKKGKVIFTPIQKTAQQLPKAQIASSAKTGWWDRLMDYLFAVPTKKVVRVIPRSALPIGAKVLDGKIITADGHQANTRDIIKQQQAKEALLSKQKKEAAAALLSRKQKESVVADEEAKKKEEKELLLKKDQEEARNRELLEQKKKLELEKAARAKQEQERMAKEQAHRLELEKEASEKERVLKEKKEAERLKKMKEDEERARREAVARKAAEVIKLKKEQDKAEKEKAEHKRVMSLKNKTSFGLSFWFNRFLADSPSDDSVKKPSKPIEDNKKEEKEAVVKKAENQTKPADNLKKEDKDKGEKKKLAPEFYAVDIIFAENSENPSAGRYLLVREIERQARMVKSQPDLLEFRKDKYIKHGSFLVSATALKSADLEKKLFIPKEVVSVSCRKLSSEEEFDDLARMTEIDDDLTVLASDDKPGSSANVLPGSKKSLWSVLFGWLGFGEKYSTDEDRFAKDHLARLKREEEKKMAEKTRNEKTLSKISKLEDKKLVSKEVEPAKIENKKNADENIKTAPKISIPEPALVIKEEKKIEPEKPAGEKDILKKYPVEVKEAAVLNVAEEAKEDEGGLISQDFLLPSEGNLAKDKEDEEVAKEADRIIKEELVKEPSAHEVNKTKTKSFNGKRWGSFSWFSRFVSSCLAARGKDGSKKVDKESYGYAMSAGSSPTVSVRDRWRATKTIKTNLIQDEAIVVFDWRRNLKFLNQVLALAVVIIACVYGLLGWFQAQKEKESREFAKKLDYLNSQIGMAEKDVMEISDFKKRLGLVNGLLGGHIYWTNLFRFLEKNTLSNVYYLGIGGDTSGNYTLRVRAGDYSSIDAQIEHLLSNKYVLKVNVEEGKQELISNQKVEAGKTITQETKTVSFDLKILLDRRIFTDPSLFE